MNLFSEKNLNWIFTILFVILIIYLITVFIGDIVDRRISNVEVRMPGSYRQFGGVDTLVNIEGPAAGVAVGPTAVVAPVAFAGTDLVTPIRTVGTPFTAPAAELAVATVNPNTGVAVVTPVTPVTTYAAVPSAVPIPVISPAVSTTPLLPPAQPIMALPTPQMNTIPLGMVPGVASFLEQPRSLAAAASAVTVQPVQTFPGVAGVPAGTVVTNPATGTVTYYKNPREMTLEQRRKFKEQGSFAKMTLQDYINWLDLWRDDQNNLIMLFPAHVPNFRKYISGIPLVQSDLTLVVTSVIMPVAVKTPGLDTGQNLYNRFFLGDQYQGAYPEVFASYPNVTTIPLQIVSTPQPVVIS